MQIERELFTALLLRAQSGDVSAEQQLVEENLPLVAAVAKRYLNRGLETEDLRQLGSIGLLKAIRKFDPSFNVCFSTYAVPLIAGEIRRYLRNDGIIKFSRSAKSLALRVRQEMQSDPDLTIDKLSDRLCVSREELAVALVSDSPVCSLDEPLPDGSGNRFDRIGTESGEERSVNRLSLGAAMQTLSDRERLHHIALHSEHRPVFCILKHAIIHDTFAYHIDIPSLSWKIGLIFIVEEILNICFRAKHMFFFVLVVDSMICKIILQIFCRRIAHLETKFYRLGNRRSHLEIHVKRIIL